MRSVPSKHVLVVVTRPAVDPNPEGRGAAQRPPPRGGSPPTRGSPNRSHPRREGSPPTEEAPTQGPTGRRAGGRRRPGRPRPSRRGPQHATPTHQDGGAPGDPGPEKEKRKGGGDNKLETGSWNPRYYNCHYLQLVQNHPLRTMICA